MNFHSFKSTSTHPINKYSIRYPIPLSFDICLISIWTRFDYTALLSLLPFYQFGIHIKVENLWLENLWQWTCHINWLPFLLDMVNKGVSTNQQIYWQHLLLGKTAQLILKSKLGYSFSFRHFAQHKYAYTHTRTKYYVLRKLLFLRCQPCTVKGKSCKFPHCKLWREPFE